MPAGFLPPTRNWKKKPQRTLRALLVTAGFLSALAVLKLVMHFTRQDSTDAQRDAEREPLLHSTPQKSLPATLFPDRGPSSTPPRYRASSIGPSDKEINELIGSVNWQQWYGLYLGPLKVGTARFTARATQSDEPGAFLFASDVVMRPSGDGRQDAILLTDARYYAGSPPYRLQAYESKDTATGRSVSAQFAAQPRLTLRADTDAEPTTRAIAPSEETLRFAFSSWLAGPGAPLHSVTFREFDKDSLTDSDVEVIPVEEKDISHGERTKRVLIVDVYRKTDDTTTRQQVTASGQLLTETMVGGISVHAESKETALDLSKNSLSPQ